MQAQPNKILASLSRERLLQLSTHIHPMTFPAGMVLYEPGELPKYVYFLDSGLAAETIATREEIGLEVSITGNEGLIGVSALLKYPSQTTRCTMRFDGVGKRMLADYFSSGFRYKTLNNLFHRYLQSRFVQMSQLAFCTHCHSAEQKLARWLLTAADCTELSHFKITHDCLAIALAVNRSTLTIVAGKLENQGLIELRRGMITITDRAELGKASCECYWMLRRERTNFLIAKPS